SVSPTSDLSMTPVRWSSEPAAVPATVNLKSVTGGSNGAGGNDVWVVGTAGYATHRSAAGTWGAINIGDSTLTLGRVMYRAVNDAWTVAVPPGASKVYGLSTTTATLAAMQPAGTIYGLWINPPPMSTLYALDSAGQILSWAPGGMLGWIAI